MTNETQSLLRKVGVRHWLVGFELLGEAVDITRSLLRNEGTVNYYKVLGTQYGASRKKISDDIRRAVGITWREHRDDMESILGVFYPYPPTPRKFIYDAAYHLNEEEG